jgi:hypothetical protein
VCNLPVTICCFIGQIACLVPTAIIPIPRTTRKDNLMPYHGQRIRAVRIDDKHVSFPHPDESKGQVVMEMADGVKIVMDTRR